MEQEEKLEEAKRLYQTANQDQRYVLESLFPELKESKDEKIRKELIENFKWFCGDYPETTKWGKDDNLLVKDIIAWLEKQGEQKPTWSEEDERNLKGIIDEIEANKNNAPDYDLATYDRFLSWLKSLKDRYTWKPSDKQMNNK